MKRLPTGDKAVTRQRARATTLADQALFLEAFAGVGVITAAAKLSGIPRQRHYEWMQEPDIYPDYAGQFQAAYEQACDRLETEAVRRAVQGWEEPVYQGGKLVGTVRKFSDRMLEILLKARRPQQFRERLSAELSGPNGSAIPVASLQFVVVDVQRSSSPD